MLQFASPVKQHEDPYYSNVSYNLLRLRNERDFSQQDVATLCNVERSKIGKMENGRLDFRFSTLVALARGLDVNILELIQPPVRDIKQEIENGSN